MSKRLKKSGVKFSWLGGNRTTFFSGRTHTKWCTVDDTVYAFGGVNLYQKGINNYDYMFKIEDGALADKLVEEYHRLAKADAGGYSYRSHSFNYGDDSVLIDGGLFGDSIIYRRACQLAAKANHVILVSQYCPTGKLARLLNKTDCQLYFNPALNAQNVDWFVIRIGMLLSGHKTLYNKSRYLHAKFMIFTMPDGSRVALTGSHNFVNAGVLFGTREVALQTENPKTIKQLDGFLKRLIT